jgi:hypothetical protein
MTHEQLKLALFQIFNIENDSLDMDDIKSMWEALMLKNKILAPAEWDEFTDRINCMASEKFFFFSRMFDQYFQPINQSI